MMAVETKTGQRWLKQAATLSETCVSGCKWHATAPRGHNNQQASNYQLLQLLTAGAAGAAAPKAEGRFFWRTCRGAKLLPNKLSTQFTSQNPPLLHHFWVTDSATNSQEIQKLWFIQLWDFCESNLNKCRCLIFLRLLRDLNATSEETADLFYFILLFFLDLRALNEHKQLRG